MPFLDRGSWRVKVRIGGQRKSKRFPAGTPKKIADDFERKLKLSLIDPNLAEKKRLEPLFKDYAIYWLEKHCALEHSYSYLSKCRQMLNQHCFPRFGKKKLSEITNQDVMQMQRCLKEKDYAVQSINNVLAATSAVFKQALFDQLVDYNPCSGIKRYKKGQQVELEVWTLEERDRFLRLLYQENFKLFQLCSLALFSGMRPSELRGLCRDAIDFERCQVRVFRQWCTKQNKLVDYTKTRQARNVPVPRQILDSLNDKRLLAGDALLFPFMCNAFGHKTLKPLMAKANVKVIRMHDLRHTFASHLMLQGSTLMEVKELLGHRKLESTMIYVHYMPDRNRGATDKLLGNFGFIPSQPNVVSFLR